MVNGRFPPFSRSRAVRLLAPALLLVLGGCRAEALVRLEVDEAGFGRVTATVSLDDAAAEKVGDLGEFVVAEDLEAAGWRVSAAADRVSIERAVQGPADVNAAFDELTGPGGPFADLEFQRDQGFVSTRSTVSGTVDLSAGLAAFGDAALAQVTGSPTGVDAPDSVLGLTLTVELPGEEDVDTPTGRASWALPLGQVTEVRAESVDLNWLGLGSSALALAAASILLAVGIRRRSGP